MSSTSQDSGYVDNWQTGKSVTECNLHMLTTEDCSDVIFRVGSEKHVVRAHRYVLVSRSCVFHAMFCGSLAEKGEVTIPDVEPNIFREFLKYVYTGIASINAENVTGLLYTSRKYDIDGLLKQCSTFLEKSLSGENVCQILEQCHQYGELDLEQKALKILTEGGEEVIKSSGFQDLCSDCLNEFLKSKKLNLKEKDTFNAALSWTRAKCMKENITLTPENLRKVLGDARLEIRFWVLPLDFLVKVVGPSGILTDSERVRIMDKMVDKGIDISPFKSAPRNTLQVKRAECTIISRFRKNRQGLNMWSGPHGRPCNGKPDAIAFTVNMNIELVGCQLYGPAHCTESTYSLNIFLYGNTYEVIAEALPKTDVVLRGQAILNDVMFRDPICLIAGRTYTISVTMIGEGTYFGIGGQMLVKYGTTEFTFSDSLKSTNGTSVDEGQIPCLIWR